MQVYLIRHGQSTNNALTDPGQRVKDPELTEAGLEQAERVAGFIAKGGHLPPTEQGGDRPVLDQLYCSAMIRTLQTVTPIGRALALRPQIWVDVHEIGGIFLDGPDGAVGYPGEGRDAIADRFPECVVPEEVGEVGWWSGGRETEEESFVRAQGIVEQLWRLQPEGQRVGVVSHGGIMDQIIKVLTGIAFDQPCYFSHYNTSITCALLAADGSATLRYVDRCHHLDPQLQTGPS